MLAIAGVRSVLRRGAVVRPSLAGPPARTDSRLPARARRRPRSWCSVEDSALLVGPPRMGKGLHVVIPWVLDAPGPVVATSTRPDTLAVTLHARDARGPGRDLRPAAARRPARRARVVPGPRLRDPTHRPGPRPRPGRRRRVRAHRSPTRDFWAGQTETALRCLLHAAALDGRRAVDLYRWSLNPALAEDAVTSSPATRAAASGWADALDAAIHADPRTRDSVWLGVRQSLAALADPDVLAAVDPAPGGSSTPPRSCASPAPCTCSPPPSPPGSCAPLVAAFVEDITETARGLAARSPGARLDPPLLLALDEIANLTPLPSLPPLMAEGGGSGITTLAVLQSLAQARGRWGEHAADAIWDAATVKLVLGGLGQVPRPRRRRPPARRDRRVHPDPHPRPRRRPVDVDLGRARCP